MARALRTSGAAAASGGMAHREQIFIFYAPPVQRTATATYSRRRHTLPRGFRSHLHPFFFCTGDASRCREWDSTRGCDALGVLGSFSFCYAIPQRARARARTICFRCAWCRCFEPAASRRGDPTFTFAFRCAHAHGFNNCFRNFNFASGMKFFKFSLPPQRGAVAFFGTNFRDCVGVREGGGMMVR